ncbi:MAG: isopropylmalate/homocitrate/citramalate synthase [Hyphomicrobium sp.]|nr:MAG: isopropylmalate/homocitrate/citramalate synthase [Hyphomicrobium sp.]
MTDTTPESQARAATAALIRDYYTAFNTGDTDAMLEFLTDDVIHDVNQGERRTGKDKFRAFNARMTHNYKEELKDIVVLVSKDATRAAAEFNVHGVYKNSEEGLPPAAGQTYVLPAGTFFAIRDGKIARVTTYYNLTDWITQVAG